MNFKVDHGHGIRTYGRKRLGEIFQFRYTEQLEFENYKVEQWIRKKCKWAYKRGYIEKVKVWLGTLHQKQLAHDIVPDVMIKWINRDIGYGVFANETLKQWDYVGEYAGLLRRRNLFYRNINDYCFMYPREWLTLKAYTIDSKLQGNMTRFINHSDTPNLEAISVLFDGVFRIMFRAIRTIKPGEELTYDYGYFYWQNRRKLS